MEGDWAGLIGLFISCYFVVIGWFLYRINSNFTSAVGLLKTDIQDAKKDTQREIQGVSKRLDKDIENMREDHRSLRESVVFSDVFVQHEKLEEARHEGMKQMNEILKENLKQSSTANKQEHDKICGKLDGLVGIIHEIAGRNGD